MTPMSNRRARPRRLLVAHGDRKTALRLSAWLKTLGKPVLAETLEQAVAEARKGPVLIFIDAGIGGDDVWEALRRVRSVSTAPVVILADGEDDPVLRAGAFALGAHALLGRPFSRVRLLALAGGLLRA